MILIVGLGNPGPTHKNNRHNIGFLAIDEIFKHHSLGNWRKKFHGQIGLGKIENKKILALKPMTYMNRSGQSIYEAKSFFNISSKNVIVIHDELDFPCGKLQIKRGGGHAGHNGLKNIHSYIGSNYARIRVGIGRPQEKGEIINHVLTDFSKTETHWVHPLIANTAKFIGLIINGEDSKFQQQVQQFTTKHVNSLLKKED
ncbi:MAG: aminoacyl-tRNA hydrolase [Magnetovibrio sp.]|nr:aminoacyl-tRNA hydrolase [Magnetovibrio sp.]